MAPENAQHYWAVVVGGGLAGMAAAHQLASQNAQPDGRLERPGEGILLVESKELLGGKARSLKDQVGLIHGETVSWTDKGYHIFPKWYWDMWSVMDEVGITSPDDHRNCTKEACVEVASGAGDSWSRFSCPHSKASRDYTLLKQHPNGVRDAVDTNTNSLKTIPAKVAMLLVMLGLIGADPERLDRRSLEDHLLRRWYAGNETLERVREIVLKALANPSIDASARTTANTFRRWMPVYLDANWRALSGPLQEELIEPFRANLEAVGVEIRTGTRVTAAHLQRDDLGSGEDARVEHWVRSLDLSDGDSIRTLSSLVVLALPPETLSGVVEWDSGRIPPAAVPPGSSRASTHPDPATAVAGLSYLESAPMASLDLYVSELPAVGHGGAAFPDAHFSLVGSQYAITGFAASKLWRPKYLDQMPAGSSHLVQFVCSDVTSLVGLSEAEALRLLRADIARFIPRMDSNVDSGGVVVEAVLLMNDEPGEQVTRNEVGTYERRPPAWIGVKNAWLAGDYCRTPVDVASMEAAVSSGLIAANEATARLAELDGRAASTEKPRKSRVLGPAPVRSWPSSGGNGFWRRLIAGIAFLGAGISFVAGTLIAILTLPYRLARRVATHDLTADPLARRGRDVVMMCCGLAVVPVGIVIGATAWARSEQFDPIRDRYSDLGAVGSGGRWVVAGGCVVLYLLLMVFAVPARRFLPWSRQCTAGLMAAALGYLAFPFFPVDNGTTPWEHYAAAAAILVGPNWSVIGASMGLEHSEDRYAMLRRIARPWAVVSAVVILVTVAMTLLEVLGFTLQVTALLVGNLWLAVLAGWFVFFDKGNPARSIAGSAAPAAAQYVASV